MSDEPKVFRIGSVQNAVVSGKRFKARLLEAGVISYKDVQGGVALLRKSTIDRCINTFVGTPITLKHKHVTNSIKQAECTANGVIERTFFDPEDGGYWCEGSVNGDAARERIKKVGKVSCGYLPTSHGPSGIYNCIPYDYEITGFIGEHLAIEERPRYTLSPVILNSQNQSATTPMYKWIKKLVTSTPETPAVVPAVVPVVVENSTTADGVATDISGDTEIMVGEEKVKLSDLTAGYTAHKQNAIASEGSLPEGASLEVDGVAVPVSDLIASHKASAALAAKREAQPTVYRIVNAKAEADVTATPANTENDTQEARLKRGKQLY